MILAVAAIALLVGADQLIKYLVVRDFALGESRQFLHIGDTELMNLTYVRNDGAAFSSMSGQRVILIGLPLLLLGICIWAMWKYGRTSPFLKWNIALVMQGVSAISLTGSSGAGTWWIIWTSGCFTLRCSTLRIAVSASGYS